MALIAGRSLSKTDIFKMQKRMASLQTRAKHLAEKADGIIEKGMATAEIGGAAFVMGMAYGRYPPEKLEFAGIPIDLGLGVALHALAFMNVGGEMTGHMHNLGNGSLAHYLVGVGRGLGVGMAQEAASVVTSGGGTDRLSEEELRDL